MNLYGTILIGSGGRSSVDEKGTEGMLLGELVIEGSLVPVLVVSMGGGPAQTPAIK